ncbi:TVP38/TMEM64 family protein [Varunaivibrio sulfuroxidans]|uniref:TVP38/TMEM64 family membrane protein n=1 Tax=Varunaivibrio sulfuroxidans TaxID=1773489 RepID=A0A4R3JD14_9PROT|nr:VTT domain-containing protein [Varunaivibrio sulfuroxidans]TCS63567.1 putative membrane protein YdjX (TVP38/TMEM64 family) [Varunaivibrio sulfuroxidans]WES30290.1 VTT domain-containing protein [Varunaivibrio sulfuroxidans]
MNPKVLIRGFIVIATLIAAGYLLRALESGVLLDASWIDTAVRGHGVKGDIIFIAAVTIATAVGLPRQAISFLGGYGFGFLAGTGLALAGSILGCLLAFYYARFVGRAFVTARYPDKVRKIDSFLHDHTFTMTLIVRLLPVGSNAVTNLAAGVSSVRSRPFLSGSALGYLPQTMIFALMGSGIAIDPTLRIGVGVVLFVTSSLLGVYLYRKLRHGKKLDDAVDSEIGGDALAPPLNEGRGPLDASGERQK